MYGDYISLFFFLDFCTEQMKTKMFLHKSCNYEEILHLEFFACQIFQHSLLSRVTWNTSKQETSMKRLATKEIVVCQDGRKMEDLAIFYRFIVRSYIVS